MRYYESVIIERLRLSKKSISLQQKFQSILSSTESRHFFLVVLLNTYIFVLNCLWQSLIHKDSDFFVSP